MTRHLLSIDPGLMTGYVRLDITDLASPALIDTRELTFPEFQDTFTRDLTQSVSSGIEVEVVIEKFKITAQTAKLSDAPWSLEHIGVVRYLCRRGNVSLSEQMPSAAKSFVDNARLRRLDLWHKGGGGHANDALRHAVLYLVEKHRWAPQNLLSTD